MTPLETQRQEAFSLTYLMSGMTFGDVEDMRSEDRIWFVERLARQLQDEKKEADLARKRRR